MNLGELGCDGVLQGGCRELVLGLFLDLTVDRLVALRKCGPLQRVGDNDALGTCLK